ncbi:uncharacterized protein LOC110026840 isoform X2 [Phalaenopsis equestris]|uniref:uncharacterized protein LOC110026840 isoform X2 n=1 Tax=Phalaenopsis equestris TaxID=78828 RepID=UPI0009E31C0A|nr:uncharacterized protein LOC110026840 isoform X2 [Phalaenopsis equestris]
MVVGEEKALIWICFSIEEATAKAFPKMSTKRWIVTYTKHMKQKRKIYQDGALELCSSGCKPQIILYDDCEKIIDRRFLKNSEIVKSGATLSFETHIVDIGDPDGSQKPPTESNVKLVIQSEAQKKLCVEWNALYTMHVTQKAKKFHDGILRALICGPHLNLVTLLNEDGAILSSKYFKSLACLETGKNCEFPNYLVEICERRASVVGQGKHVIGSHAIEFEGHNDVGSLCQDLPMKDSLSQVLPSKPERCGKLVTSIKRRKIPICNVPKKETSRLRTTDARASAAPSKEHLKKVTNDCKSEGDSFSYFSTATLRDAWQILSVLKKPNQGSTVLSVPLVDQDCTSQSSSRRQLDLQTALDISPTKFNINSIGGHTSSTTEVLEVSGDPKLPGSSRTNKPDKPTSDFGFSPEVKQIVPPQNSLGALNGEHHISSSTGSLLKDKLDANESSSLHGMKSGISSYSASDQLYAEVSHTGERNESVSLAVVASTEHATSDATKNHVIPNSLEDFPTFDLVL